MSFNEVNELRKAGKLAEALKIAVDDYNALFMDSNQLAQVNTEYDTAEFGVKPTVKSAEPNKKTEEEPQDLYEEETKKFIKDTAQELINNDDKETVKILKDSIDLFYELKDKYRNDGVPRLAAAKKAKANVFEKFKGDVITSIYDMNDVITLYNAFGLSKEMSNEDAWDAVVEYNKGNTKLSKPTIEETEQALGAEANSMFVANTTTKEFEEDESFEKRLKDYAKGVAEDIINNNDKETLNTIKDAIKFYSDAVHNYVNQGLIRVTARSKAREETFEKYKGDIFETIYEIPHVINLYDEWGLTKEMSYEDAWNAVVEYSKGNTNSSRATIEVNANIQILNELRSKFESANRDQLRYFDEEFDLNPILKEFIDDDTSDIASYESINVYLDSLDTKPELEPYAKYAINKYLLRNGYKYIEQNEGSSAEAPRKKMRPLTPDNAPTAKNKLWAKRALAWVYYDYLKVYIEKEDVGNFIATLEKINQLELNSEEHLFFDQCAYVIAKMVFAIKRKNNIDFDDISRIFNLIKDYPFTKPSEGYSALFNAFNKEGSKWPNFLEFADWWDFENFDKKSYIPFVLNGRNLLSTAEQAFINYAKSLLSKFGSSDYQEHDVENLKRIGHQFITQLDKLIEEHPEFMYPPYYKAKLLIALGEGKMKETLEVFIPFARQRKRDFWVWDMMAQLFPDDDEMVLSCYCKALSCPTTDEFLVNIRQSFAGFLIDQKKYSEAKSEILNVLNTRKANKWRIPEIVNFWCNQDWFISSTANLDNKYFYDQHKTKAEEILYRGMEEEIIVVEFVNSERKILNFIKTKEKSGFFKYQGFIVNPQIGDILAVRFSNSVNEGRYGILSCRNLDSNTLTDAIREFEGVFKPAQSGRFGFADDAYVDETLIAKYQLENFNIIKGKAMLSFNKKKGTWGWKAIEIYKSELT